MAPANNLERQAARRIAGAGNIKYTEALRRLRESGVQPSQILDGTVDAASIPNTPSGTGTVLVGELHKIAETQASMAHQRLDLDALRRAAMSRPDVRPALLPQEMFELGAYADLLTADDLKGQVTLFKDPAAQELLKIVLESQGEPSISLLGIPGSGKTFLLAKLSVAARAIPDVRVFTASGTSLSTVAGLPEFLREAQSAQQTALVLLDNASGFGGTRATDPDHELGRAVAEHLILRGHPAAAVLAVSHLPLAGETSDSDRVFMGWQHMTLPVAVDPEITAAGEHAGSRYTPLYVPAKGEPRLLGNALAALTRMPSPQHREAAAVPVPAKPVNPLAKEECPGDFLWSAFGADYPDTQCENGRLVDMDSGNISEIPCPFDDSEAFTEYQFGDPTLPECSRCSRILPVGTEIHYHEGDYGSLWWSAACPDCGLQRVNMVDHSDDEDIDALCEAREQEARAGHALARAVKIDYAEALDRLRITKVSPSELLAVEAGAGHGLAAQTLLAGGIPELYPFDPAQPEMTSMRFQNPPGQTLSTTAEGHGYKVTAEPVEPPSFTLGTDAATGEPLRAVLAGQVWEHTAICGDGAATTAELLRIAAELTDQGVAVTVFSGNPEQSWPWQARVVHTGPGHWADARAAADEMTNSFVGLMLHPVDDPEPLVILVDSAAMSAVPSGVAAEEREHVSHVAHLWREWTITGRFAGWTMVTAMEFGATRALKDMAWVLVPDAAQVSWSGWPQEGRVLRNRHGMIHSVHP